MHLTDCLLAIDINYDRGGGRREKEQRKRRRGLCLGGRMECIKSTFKIFWLSNREILGMMEFSYTNVYRQFFIKKVIDYKLGLLF